MQEMKLVFQNAALRRPSEYDYPILVWHEECGFEVWNEKLDEDDNYFREGGFFWAALPEEID